LEKVGCLSIFLVLFEEQVVANLEELEVDSIVSLLQLLSDDRLQGTYHHLSLMKVKIIAVNKVNMEGKACNYLDIAYQLN
jgi:hypothetical protein